MNKTLSALSAVLLVCAAAPAAATAVVFNDEAAFAAATGGTLHALTSGVNGTTVSSVDGELTLSQVTGSLITDWTSYTGADRLAGVEMAISGFESFDASVSLGADRYSFGFGIYESTDNGIAGCNATCFDSTFEITLFNNGSALAPSFFLSPTDDVAVFWGVHTDFAFDAIQIRETIGGNDNEIFGTFYTGRTAVPEPGTLLLTGAGLALAGLRRRRA